VRMLAALPRLVILGRDEGPPVRPSFAVQLPSAALINLMRTTRADMVARASDHPGANDNGLRFRMRRNRERPTRRGWSLQNRSMVLVRSRTPSPVSVPGSTNREQSAARSSASSRI